MTIKRIFASTIALLMLSVSSMAAACDLSCSFAQRQSDCHARDAKRLGSTDAGIADDMAMDGMAMPDMAGGEDQAAVAENAQGMPSHASIGEMGPCERQSCDNGTAISARNVRSATPRFHFVLAAIEAGLAHRACLAFHDARDDVATFLPRDGSPLVLALRI